MKLCYYPYIYMYSLVKISACATLLSLFSGSKNPGVAAGRVCGRVTCRLFGLLTSLSHTQYLKRNNRQGMLCLLTLILIVTLSIHSSNY